MSIEKNESSIYKQYPFLEEYKEHIKLSEIDIIWEWNYWIILNWPLERVYKIWKNSNFSQQLQKEYNNHIKFYIALEELKDKLDCNESLFIPEVAKKPKIIEWKLSWEDLFIYEMEKIKWKTLLSYLIKEELENQWLEINLSNYTDYSLEELYKQKTWKDIDELRNWTWVDIDNEGKKLMKSIQKWQKKWVWEQFPSYLINKYFPEQYKDISELLFKLKKMWYKHLDLHSKNFMITYHKNKPQIYIIDFWIVKINNNK